MTHLSLPLRRVSVPRLSLRWVLLALFPVVAGIWAITVGRYPVPVGDVLSILGLPWPSAEPASNIAQSVVLRVRLPRVLEALVCGAGLGVGGAAFQGVFRNPLVGPQIIGVSTGAAFGGALAIFMGFGLS